MKSLRDLPGAFCIFTLTPPPRGWDEEDPMILEKINADLISAMKDREPARKEANQAKVLTLRTLLAEVKSFLVNNRREPSDEEVAAILQKGIKQFKETLDKAKGRN